MSVPAIYADPTRFTAFDTETWLIEPGLLAPPLVCGSAAWLSGAGSCGILLGKRGRDDLDVTPDTIETFTALLESDRVIVGANIAYDVLVLAVAAQLRGIDLCPSIFEAYAADRIYDVQLAEAEHGIGKGLLGRDLVTGAELRGADGKPTKRYSLWTCVAQVLAREDAKENDEWRLRYAELDGTPIAQWPVAAATYPLDDARNTLEVALAQCGHLPSRDAHELDSAGVCTRCASATFSTPHCMARRPRFNLHDVPAQTRKALGLHFGAAWGLRAVRARVEALAAAAAGGTDRAPFIAAGFIRAEGTEDQAVVKRACARAYGASAPCVDCKGAGKVPSPKSGNPINCKTCSGTALDLDACSVVPRTDGGSVSISRDALGESGDELLMAYGESAEDEKITTTYVPTLLRACEVPLNLRPNPLLETARNSYSGTEQTFPRNVSPHLYERMKAMRDAGLIAPFGVRDCFEARPGSLYYSVDDSGGELVTWAESSVERVGFSDLGQALVAGLDAHSAFAATMLGEQYEDFVRKLKVEKSRRHKDTRQAAKPANFGFPGGMGPWKLVLQQRKQGPDTPHPSGPSKVWDGKAWVPGYKGLRFCVLIGGAERCGETKVTEWKGREGPPTCRRCIECAETLKDTWLRQWREAKPYLKWHADNADQRGWVEQVYSKRRRGGTDYCSEANGDFQALLADINARARWQVWAEQHVRLRVDDEDSAFFGMETPLYGVSHGILDAHDEQFGETREDVGHEVCLRIQEVMEKWFRIGCPNHAKACKAEPTLMRAWHKAAEPKYREGRLVAWDS